MGGSARHFLDHHLPSPKTLPKKIHFLQTTHRNFPSPSLPPPRPPHRNIPAELPWPTRALAILIIRLPAGAASSTPSSTGPDHPRRTSKPYAHPAVYRSRFSCGIVHPTGAVVHRIGYCSPTPLCMNRICFTGAMHDLNSSIVAFLLLACKFLFTLGGTCLC